MSSFIIVDDAAIVRMRLKSIIQESGHTVVGEAENGKVAVDLYKKEKADCVTLDISMPEQDGLETLKQILSINKEAKAIMISAVGQKQLVIQALQIGAKDFIIKPFDAEQVKKVIHKWIMP